MLGRFGLRRRIAGQEEALSLLGFVKEERAAIAEYHGGPLREDVEALAWAEMDALLERGERGAVYCPQGACGAVATARPGSGRGPAHYG